MASGNQNPKMRILTPSENSIDLKNYMEDRHNVSGSIGLDPHNPSNMTFGGEDVADSSPRKPGSVAGLAGWKF